MSDVDLVYSDSKIIVRFNKKNEALSEFLLLGLEFRQIDDTHIVKEYSSNDQIMEDMSFISQKIEALKIEVYFDKYLAPFVETVATEAQDLKDSLIVGKTIKDSAPNLLELSSDFYLEPQKSQVKSINHIISVSNTANFSVPGSGKTMISLAAYSVLKSKGIVDRLLVIGPLSCFLTWEEEYKKCFKVSPKSIRITGQPEDRVKLYGRSENTDIFLMTYHMLKYEEGRLQDLLKKHKFFMILDESHHIKSFHEGIHANVVRKIGKYAKRRLILSGTPVPNGLEDLWSQFTFLWPNEKLLGTKAAFKARLARNSGSIKEILDPLFIRINKNDLNIPPPEIERIRVKLTDEHYEFYYELAKSFLYDASKLRSKEEKMKFYRICMAWLIQSIDDPNKLMLNENFRTIAHSNPKLVTALSNYNKNPNPKKITLSKNLIDKNIADGQKSIYWTYFVKNIIQLNDKELKHTNPLLVYGGIPKDDSVDEDLNREKNIKAFKNDPKRMVLLANPAACAESISLQYVCRNAIYLDRTFNCAQYLQSLDRIHRIGINWRPKIKLLIAENTLDQRVDTRLLEKEARMLELLDDPFTPINLETSDDDYFGEVNQAMKVEEMRDLEIFEEELEKAKK